MKIEYEGTEFGDPIEISSTADDTEWEGFSDNEAIQDWQNLVADALLWFPQEKPKRVKPSGSLRASIL
jgi:hypothetical protein